MDKIDRIRDVDRPDPLRFERVDPTTWGRQRARLREELGLALPTLAELPRFGDVEELRVLLRRYVLTIDFVRGDWIQIEFRPGFITDLASVPGFFRGLVDNDDLRILPAALAHDLAFTTHYLGEGHKGFEAANLLFYRMLRARGYNLVKSVIAYAAVSSIAGRARYEKNTARDEWTERTVTILRPRAA